MKRILIPAIILILTLSLCACGSDEKDPVNTDIGGDEFFFETKGNKIKVDMDMAEVLDAIGEPMQYYEATSCAFEGLDKTYTYPSFVITTRPDGEQDLVSCITLTDDSVSTVEGAYIGCDKALLEELYADGKESTGGIKYSKGDSTLHFILSENEVISIEYLSNAL